MLGGPSELFFVDANPLSHENPNNSWQPEGSRPVTCGARGVQRRVRTPAKMFAFHAFVTRNSVDPLHVKQLLVVHPVTDSPSVS